MAAFGIATNLAMKIFFPPVVPYEEIDREALTILRPELFEGFSLGFTKGLNEKLSLSDRMMMGFMEVPFASIKILALKLSEFGAKFTNYPKLMLTGGVTNGNVNADMKFNVTENFTLGANAQMSNKTYISLGGLLSLDYKGKNYRTQFQLSESSVFRASQVQSVTRCLSLGSEAFWDSLRRKVGLSFAARYNTDSQISTAKVTSTGMASLSYVQKVSKKLYLATDFMYNYMSNAAVANVGFCYNLPQSRVRGKIDSNGNAALFLEDHLDVGLKFILSAEVNPRTKDHKFGVGIGLTSGE